MPRDYSSRFYYHQRLIPIRQSGTFDLPANDRQLMTQSDIFEDEISVTAEARDEASKDRKEDFKHRGEVLTLFW